MILVASYPKSGATWFSVLMHTCRVGTLEQTAEIAMNHPDLLVPREHKHISRLLDAGAPFFVKSHLPYFEDHPYREHIRQCVYLVRNPFDVMVSKLSHYLLEDVPFVQSEEGQRAFFELLIGRADKTHFETHPDLDGGWTNHVRSWLRENTEIPTYLVRYEDLLADAEAVIRQLSEALNLGFDPETIRTGVALARFDNLRAIEAHEIENEIPGMFYSEQRKKAFEKNLRFLNRGKAGVYREMLDEDLLQAGRQAFAEGMKLAGYD